MTTKWEPLYWVLGTQKGTEQTQALNTQSLESEGVDTGIKEITTYKCIIVNFNRGRES